MNLELKGIMQYGKWGLMILKAGKDTFSFIRQRLRRKNKKQKVKKLRIRERRQQSQPHAFFCGREGICKRGKIVLRVLLIIKERYF